MGNNPVGVSSVAVNHILGGSRPFIPDTMCPDVTGWTASAQTQQDGG